MSEDKTKIVQIEELTASASASLAVRSGSTWKSTHRIVKWEELPEDHQIYNAIGRVASQWAYYELLLDDMIRALIKAEGPLVTAITAQMMGAGNRLNAIRALCTVRNLSKSVHDKINSVSNATFA